MHQIKLITGIPRSGTTLCCHILNQQEDYIALHEPIRPDKFAVNQHTVTKVVKDQVEVLESAIKNGEPFEHGDKGGLTVVNPVGIKSVDGKRQLSAHRGEISLPQFKGKAFTLVVKQNAFFTAYLPQLCEVFDIVCIVRNPVEVFLSWWTVNLPVSQGRLPAGVQNDKALAQALHKHTEVSARQMMIYRWFSEKYKAQPGRVLKYEDIIHSSGKVLTDYFKLQRPNLLPLNRPARHFSATVLDKLSQEADELLNLSEHSFYSREEIKQHLSLYLD